LGYTSGNLLAASQDIWDNTTLALVGMGGVIPGTYVWRWGGAPDQTFTIEAIAPTATPLPGTLPLFATGIGIWGLFGRLRKRSPAAVAA